MTWEDGLKNPALTYDVSKKFAELAATAFVKDEQPSFDVAILNPYAPYSLYRLGSEERSQPVDLRSRHQRASWFCLCCRQAH